MAARRAKYLATPRPVAGETMYRNGKAVQVVGTNDFEFEIKI